ncbi:hypothetical protein E1A91_D12G200100v1 [Gossypium mustelinum]|uniref:ABC transporter domain-containing protein n=1 Tax=Gossypium mustelinum TaxID=34275 RepID=A0A5D2SGS9_GOSMU|nr:hypothetical protein E1A91_D12G200100v1 [Gossypium mustelinum]
MDSLQSLPPLSTLSTSVSSALNAKLGTNHDLTQAPSIVAEFLTQCDDLERNLVHLNRTLESNLASYASFSNRIGHLFGIVNSKLTDLGSSVCLRSSVSAHSMEEVDVLCDRLGIFVDGALQCIGNEKEGRYRESYIFIITTSSSTEEEVENMVQYLSLNANKIYQISGTQKFKMPKQEVRIADVFQAVENAKSRFTVFAWGLADTTLEDVFIKVARGAQVVNILS